MANVKDAFGLLGDRLDIRFRYKKEEWKRVAAALKDAEAASVVVVYDLLLDTTQVSLRDALEIEVGLYLVKREFGRKFPMLTRYQIRTELQKTKRYAEKLLQRIREPAVGLYLLDWGPHRGGPRGTILFLETLLAAVNERERWLATSNPNAPFPGNAWPKDTEPPEDGFPWQHRGLNTDARESLISGVLGIFEKITKRLAGTQPGGPAARFVQAAVHPVLGVLKPSDLRQQMRKYRG